MTEEIRGRDELEEALDQEEARLRAEVEAAFEATRRKPTIANRKTLDRAKKALETFLAARSAPAAAEETLDGLPEALEYLKAREWKIEKTKIYDDKAKGRVPLQADGRILASDLEEYARLYLVKNDGTPGAAAGISSLQEQKLQADAARSKNQAALLSLKLQTELGQVIPFDQVEIELAQRASYLKSDLRNVGRAGCMEIIRIVNGDPQKAADFIAFWLEAVDEILDRYARPMEFTE